MKPGPVVSVIIAVFNAEKYVVRAISSALDQTMAELEVIVVDDGSTDATVSKVQSIQDERVRLYTLHTNQGPSFCRNYAIQRAKGKWIAILDGDDWWDPTRLDVLLKHAVRDHAQVVCDDLHLVVNETSPPHNTYLKSRETVIGRVTKAMMINPLQMIHDDYGVLQPLIQADFIQENSIAYNARYRFGEDFVLLLDCLLAGAKMMLYPEPYYYYRTGHASSSSSSENSIRQCNMLEELISAPPYSQLTQIREALQEKLNRKRLIVEELRAKQMFQQKKFVKGITTVLQHPSLLVGYARVVKRKIVSQQTVL